MSGCPNHNRGRCRKVHPRAASRWCSHCLRFGHGSQELIEARMCEEYDRAMAEGR